jgi:hypothetical protein
MIQWLACLFWGHRWSQHVSSVGPLKDMVPKQMSGHPMEQVMWLLHGRTTFLWRCSRCGKVKEKVIPGVAEEGS